MSRLFLPPFRGRIGHQVAATLAAEVGVAAPPPTGNELATGGALTTDTPTHVVHTFSSSGSFTLDAVGILKVDVTFTGTGSFGVVSSDGPAYVDPAGTVVTITSGDVVVSYDPSGDYVDGMTVFLDPSMASTVHDTTGSVDTLDDLTGVFVGTAPGSGNRPITGTRTIGGLNGLDYDGSNDCLQIPAYPDNTTFTIFTVQKWDSYASFKMSFETGTDVGSSSRGVAQYTSAGNLLEFLVRGTSLGVKRYTLTDTANAHQMTWEAGPLHADLNLRIDGSNQSPASVIATNPGAGSGTITLNLGARNGGSIGWDGIFGPFIAFHGTAKPTTTKRGIVESYLKTKWGTP